VPRRRRITGAVIVGAALVGAWIGVRHLALGKKPVTPFLGATFPAAEKTLEHAGFLCVDERLLPVLIFNAVQGGCHREGAGRVEDVIFRGEDSTHIQAVATSVVAPKGDVSWLRLATGFLSDPDERRRAFGWSSHHVGHEGALTLGSVRVEISSRPNGRRVLVLHSRSYLSNSAGSRQALDPFTAEALATQFEPVLFFSHGEHFFPLRFDVYANAAQLCVTRVIHVRGVPRLREKCRPGTSAPTSRANCRPKRKDGFMKGEAFLAFDSNARDSASADPRRVQPYTKLESSLRAAAGREYTVYWHAAGIGAAHVMVEYWFFYSFDDFANRHEGDWEWIGVEAEKKPFFESPNAIRVFYSQHEGGGWRDWSEVMAGRDRRGDSPIVFVARGSHANYFTPRKLPAAPTVQAVCKRKLRRTVCLVGHDSLTQPSFVLEPATTTSTSPSMGNGPSATYRLEPYPSDAYSGAYGPGNYIPTPVWSAGRWLKGLGPFAPQCKSEFDHPVTAFEKADHEAGVR
jgi:hypothetical protein